MIKRFNLLSTLIKHMIRLARIKDSPTVHKILLSAKDDIPLAENFADQKHSDWVSEQCRKKFVWIDERDHKIAGVMVMSVTEVFYLVTTEEFRALGVASGLIDHAIALVKRRYRTGITARACENNAPIIQLLIKKGFYRHPVLQAGKSDWAVFAFGEVR